MSSQPINSPTGHASMSQHKKFNAWKTLQDFSPVAAARRNRNNATGLLTVNQKNNLMLSPLNIGGINDQMREEMSKTPSYRTD